MAAAYVPRVSRREQKVLVIATDVSVVDERVDYTEPVMGAAPRRCSSATPAES